MLKLMPSTRHLDADLGPGVAAQDRPVAVPLRVDGDARYLDALTNKFKNSGRVCVGRGTADVDGHADDDVVLESFGASFDEETARVAAETFSKCFRDVKSALEAYDAKEQEFLDRADGAGENDPTNAAEAVDHEIRLALYAATQFYIVRRAEKYAKEAREEYEHDRKCVHAAAKAKRKANAEAGEAEPEVKKPRLETPEEIAAALGDVTEQLIKKVEQEQPYPKTEGLVAWKGSRPPTEAERATWEYTPDASDYL